MIDEKLVHSEVKDAIYVHDSFASIFRGMLDWFSNCFETRFSYKVISTYDKAVQFFNSKRMAKDGSIQTNILPSITLDPNLDFLPEERVGKLLWQYSNLNPLLGRYFSFKLNLQDQGVLISSINTRYQGTVDVTFWLSSIYELIDFRTKLIQYCGGTGRWIRPQFFWSNLILPKELVEFDKTNSGKQLDWSALPLDTIQLQTTSSKEYAVPYQINSIWRLDSLSDGSTKYGADQLTEWRFTATFTWEANIPTYLRLDNYTFPDMKPSLNFSIGPTYASQPLLTNIRTLDVLREDEVIKDYLKNNQVFTIDRKVISEDSEETRIVSPFVKLDSTQYDRYPLTYQDFNHICCGTLYTIDQLKGMEKTPSDFILLLDKYDPSDSHYLRFMRLSNGCICRYDNIDSDFYQVVNSIKLPTICNIDIKLYNMLLKHTKEDITMDSIAGRIYSGILKKIMLTSENAFDKENSDICSHIVEMIETTDSYYNDDKYKKLDIGSAIFTQEDKQCDLGTIDSDSKSVKLPVCISKDMQQNVRFYMSNNLIKSDFYTIQGNRVYFDSSFTYDPDIHVIMKAIGLYKSVSLGLAVNYHMTKKDESDYYTKKKLITIELPACFDTSFTKCCSYTGLLNENTDYECNGNILTFKIEPLRDKVIQVFANRK